MSQADPIKWQSYTPVDRGKVLRDLFATNDGVIEHPAGPVNFGAEQNVFMPSKVDLRGPGFGLSVYTSGYCFNHFDSPQFLGAAFEMGHDFHYHGITFNHQYDKNDQAVAFGCANGNIPDTRKGRLSQFQIMAQCWGVYFWVGTYGNTLDMEDGVIVSGYQGVSLCGSGYAQAQIVTGRRMKIMLIPSRSNYGGPTSGVSHKDFGGNLAIVVRGGELTLEDSQVGVMCGKPGLRVAGVTDYYSEGRTDSKIHLERVKFCVPDTDAMGRESYDADCRSGEMTLVDCTGLSWRDGKAVVSNGLRTRYTSVAYQQPIVDEAGQPLVDATGKELLHTVGHSTPRIHLLSNAA